MRVTTATWRLARFTLWSPVKPGPICCTPSLINARNTEVVHYLAGGPGLVGVLGIEMHVAMEAGGSRCLPCRYLAEVVVVEAMDFLRANSEVEEEVLAYGPATEAAVRTEGRCCSSAMHAAGIGQAERLAPVAADLSIAQARMQQEGIVTSIGLQRSDGFYSVIWTWIWI